MSDVELRVHHQLRSAYRFYLRALTNYWEAPTTLGYELDWARRQYDKVDDAVWMLTGEGRSENVVRVMPQGSRPKVRA